MIWIVVGGLSALLYGAWLTHEEISLQRTAAKVLATAALICAAITMGAPSLIVVGLAFGTLGDGFLSRDLERGFLPGLASFFVGHALYLIWAFQNIAIEPPEGALLWIAVLCALCALLLLRWWSALGPLRWAVSLYVALSVTLGAHAILAAYAPNGAVFAYGVAAFLLSDIILAEQLFKMEKSDAKFRLASSTLWAFYWLGQLGILLGSLALVA